MGRADILRPRYEQSVTPDAEFWLSPLHHKAAEELAVSVLGPLGVIMAMHEHEPRPAAQPATEAAPVQTEVWQSPETSVEPANMEPGRLQGRAAIYFAEHSLN